MALVQALTTAISGLTCHQQALDNIGNNIANVNTTAFKKGIYSFSTLLEQTISGGTTADETTGRGSINPISIGLGVQTSSITKDYTQGSMTVTGNVRDMAIDGNGYFVLRQGNSYVYTRDGSFYLGTNNELLGSSGLQVQGVMADEDGEISETGELADLIIPIGETGGAQETTEASFTGNLDSDEEVATGIQLVSAVPADADAVEALGSALDATDTTWNALTGAAGAETMINGGSVETSASFAVYTGGTPAYAAANLTTDLADLYYLSGDTWIQPFAGIANGEEITIDFEKGGRTESATFVYDVSQGSNTLRDFLEFLAGDVDNVANVDSVSAIENLSNTNTSGGVMGLIDVSGNVNSTINGGTAAYNSPVETAGAFTRTYDNSVDYGDGVLADSFNVSLLSNLGSENTISGITISYNNVKQTDIFANDLEYSEDEGGSTSTSMVVYDSLGNAKEVTVTLTLVDRDTNFSTWRWVADSFDDTDAAWITDGAGNLLSSSNVGTGLIRFDSDGNFVKGTELSETGGIEITLEDQGVGTPLVISLREGLSSSSTQDLDFSALTQVATDFNFNLKAQDGTAPGTLNSFAVTEDGVIQGVYSNGVVKDLGRICLALIPNENGLIAAGDNLYYEGPSSGEAQIAFAGVGGRGSVTSGSLEGSNVDLSEEFTNLITIQRGYQANARVITTADEMLQELVNLKR